MVQINREVFEDLIFVNHRTLSGRVLEKLPVISEVIRNPDIKEKSWYGNYVNKLGTKRKKNKLGKLRKY